MAFFRKEKTNQPWNAITYLAYWWFFILVFCCSLLPVHHCVRHFSFPPVIVCVFFVSVAIVSTASCFPNLQLGKKILKFWEIMTFPWASDIARLLWGVCYLSGLINCFFTFALWAGYLSMYILNPLITERVLHLFHNNNFSSSGLLLILCTKHHVPNY